MPDASELSDWHVPFAICVVYSFVCVAVTFCVIFLLILKFVD